MFVAIGYGAIADDRTATFAGELLFSFLWIPLGAALILERETTALTVVIAGSLALSGGVELYLAVASNPQLGENAADIPRMVGILLWAFRLQSD
ncbi:hypothetical protein [Haladaptatus sp. DFWS20]|uniref:hypothetical protein n=1 Tax=Haladaptatus sp. DFWS20 TaxID=3403467 RepID=UPI003EBE2CAA